MAKQQAQNVVNEPAPEPVAAAAAETAPSGPSLIDQIRAKVAAEVEGLSEEQIRAEFLALQEKKAKQKARAAANPLSAEAKERGKAREKAKREKNKAILARAKELGITA